MVDQELERRVAAFLYTEARLMDENRYEEWLELYDSECVYWAPTNDEDYDPNRHTSILYGGRPMLENLVSRLAEGKAFAQSPKSRMRRMISNIETSLEDSEIVVGANFLITEVRARVQRIHSGRSEYRLLETDKGLRIRSKKITLVGIDEPQENVTFLL
jgi:3-phenylpropionate/cinnamic acid dioxygenase small subunit